MQRIDILPLNKHGRFIIFYKTPACFYMSVPPADPKLSVLPRMLKFILNKQKKLKKWKQDKRTNDLEIEQHEPY